MVECVVLAWTGRGQHAILLTTVISNFSGCSSSIFVTHIPCERASDLEKINTIWNRLQKKKPFSRENWQVSYYYRFILWPFKVLMHSRPEEIIKHFYLVPLNTAETKWFCLRVLVKDGYMGNLQMPRVRQHITSNNFSHKRSNLIAIKCNKQRVNFYQNIIN